jgi:hypothetical protein
MNGSPVKKIIIVIIWIVIAYGEATGIIHSLNKHKKDDGLYAVILPPLAWYRSAEVWWHNNEDYIDWKEQLKTDARDCLILFTQYGKANTWEITKAVSDIKTRLNKYPHDKSDYVKSFCKDYIIYYDFARKEFNKWVIKFFNDGDIRYQKSNELNTMQNSLYKYEVEEMTRSVRHTDSLFVLLHYEYSRMKQTYLKATLEGKKQYLEIIFEKDNNNLHNLKAAYKDIFNEVIKL